MFTPERIPARRFVGMATAFVLVLAGLLIAPAGAGAAGLVVVSGRITDGSGHGWPLLAKVTAVGSSAAPVLTNPNTGKYQIKVNRNSSYELDVVAEYAGYQSVAQNITVATKNTVADISVPVATSCTAPGYKLTAALSEAFDGPSTPAGWTVENNTAAGGWVFNDPHPRGNLTGGSGGFAMVDSDYDGSGNTEDTYLTTPVVDLSSAPDPHLDFDTDYRDLSSVAQVDVSVDGGGSWSTVWDQSGADFRGPSHVSIDLPQAAGQAAVQVRFHYTGTWAWWWELDNVVISPDVPACDLVPGGLVAGLVKDPFTHKAVVGATVTSVDDPSVGATVTAPQADPMVPKAFYVLFSPLTGTRQFVAAASPYPSETQTVDVEPDHVTAANFQMFAARLTGAPRGVRAAVLAGKTRIVPLTIVNHGKAAGTADWSSHRTRPGCPRTSRR